MTRTVVAQNSKTSRRPILVAVSVTTVLIFISAALWFYQSVQKSTPIAPVALSNADSASATFSLPKATKTTSQRVLPFLSHNKFAFGLGITVLTALVVVAVVFIVMYSQTPAVVDQVIEEERESTDDSLAAKDTAIFHGRMKGVLTVSLAIVGVLVLGYALYMFITRPIEVPPKVALKIRLNELFAAAESAQAVMVADEADLQTNHFSTVDVDGDASIKLKLTEGLKTGPNYGKYLGFYKYVLEKHPNRRFLIRRYQGENVFGLKVCWMEEKQINKLPNNQAELLLYSLSNFNSSRIFIDPQYLPD